MKKFFRFKEFVAFCASSSPKGAKRADWNTRKTRSGKFSPSASTPHSKRLKIEELEDRRLLSVWNVNTAENAAAWDTTDEVVYLGSVLSAGLSAAPLAVPTIEAAEVLDTTVTLAWGKIVNAGTYALQQSTDGITWTNSTVVNDDVDEANYYATVSCEADTTYQFRVRSVSEDAEFTDSDYSSPLEVTTLQTDLIALGTTFLAAASGTYTAPTVIGERTLVVVDGQWRWAASESPNNIGGTIILNGEGACFTGSDGVVTSYTDEPVAINIDGFGDTSDYQLELSDDFVASVPLDLASETLGDLYANNFTAPQTASVTFYLDGTEVTGKNFTVQWNAVKNGFTVNYLNTDITEGNHVVTVAVDYNDGEGAAEFASTQFAFAVNVINGMTISGIGGTDWVWNESAHTLTILSESVVLTGEAAESMTILIHKGASVSDGNPIMK